MSATYTLANAVTEICHKVGDHDELLYGAYEPNGYNRAKKLFWEAVNMIIEPDQLKASFPSLYDYAINLPENDIYGLIGIATRSIDSSGEVDLADLTQFMKLIEWNNNPGTTGNAKYIRKIPMSKIGNMGTKTVVPDDVLYAAEEKTILRFYPTDSDDRLRVKYIKTPDNNTETTTSLLLTVTTTFILKAVDLASNLLEKERTRK